ncbi:MAG: ankyrin repeat domain-containing protein, partial [Methylococcales bacterium]
YIELMSTNDKERYYLEKIMNKFKGRQKWRTLEELLTISADILLIDDLSNGVNSTNACNESAIHLAASWGDVEAIDLLVAQGAAIDEPGDCDCTPLYNAVMNSNKDAVALLLKLGAAPLSKNDIGFNPYELAVHYKNQEIIQEFIPYV